MIDKAASTNLLTAGDPAATMLVPRITVQAFCETPQTREAIRAAFADRRMSRAHGAVMEGGIPAAIQVFQTQPTPNLLIVEAQGSREAMLASLAELAEVCQPDTKVIVVGVLNDVILYRELMRQGVSEYIVAPLTPLLVVENVSSLYRGEKAAPLGRVIAFAGVKGGAGSSTLAHNCAYELPRLCDAETVAVDLDLAFGTAALGFNTDASGGILEALTEPDRIDALLLDRLLVKLGDKLSLLGGPGGVDRDFVIASHAVEAMLTEMRGSVPLIVLDMPTLWAPWVRYALLHADHVVLTAEPDLAGLRNAKAFAEMLQAARPNDPPPSLVLNRVGIPKRPEIPAADFRKAIGLELAATVPFDPENFGAALSKGKMVLEVAPRSKAAEALRKLAVSLAGEKARKPSSQTSSFLARFRKMGKA